MLSARVHLLFVVIPLRADRNTRQEMDTKSTHVVFIESLYDMGISTFKGAIRKRLRREAVQELHVGAIWQRVA
jgi:hypothetical protein